MKRKRRIRSKDKRSKIYKKKLRRIFGRPNQEVEKLLDEIIYSVDPFIKKIYKKRNKHGSLFRSRKNKSKNN